MNKNMQKTKMKEPVRLRMKSLANGNQSLYLDTYINGRRSYEFLRLYLVPEKSETDKTVNSATIRAAISIKAKRILALVNGKADIKTDGNHFSVEEWIEKVIDIKRGSHSISSISLLKRLLKHLEIYRPSVGLCDVDRAFCKGFADYLRSAQALNSTKPLMQATQFELMNALSIILNEAVRVGLISCNPLRLLNVSERPRKAESSREYLTPEEVRSLLDAAGENIAAGDDVAAFLFCCFCGLRYSDVVRLKWNNISTTDKGKVITTIMKKTNRRVEVPISRIAASILPVSGAPDANVFSFPHYYVTARKLSRIAGAAGIKKKVTFHVSRHTFATMMLTAGADLYTISKLIGHSDVRTTQIYSKVVDKKKREAIKLLDKLF